MPRWPEDSRRRLVDAATGLFSERGFAATTVDEIAARAGVTARTFFRHFADKEEVLFADDDALLPTLLGAIAEPTGPIAADALMLHTLTRLAEAMEPGRASLRARQRIIDGDVALEGRELAKQARWQRGVADTLADRGFSIADAELLAAIGFAVFTGELHAWLAEGAGPSLAARVRAALPRSRAVMDAVSAR